MEGEDGNIAHKKDFPLNDAFEDILDTFGDSKEIGNDCEEDSESVSNTKVTYYAYVSFLITCFKAKEKACKKTSFACWVAKSFMLQSYGNCAEIKN